MSFLNPSNITHSKNLNCLSFLLFKEVPEGEMFTPKIKDKIAMTQKN
jgi:hypothetical protein